MGTLSRPQKVSNGKRLQLLSLFVAAAENMQSWQANDHLQVGQFGGFVWPRSLPMVPPHVVGGLGHLPHSQCIWLQCCHHLSWR